MKKWTTHDIESQKGKTAVITGTGGLGYECALALAAAGARVILAGRNATRGATAISKIKKIVPDADIRLELVDLASLESIRLFCERLLADGHPIDILINNAAVMAIPTLQTTNDWFELQFGTNHLGHFLLTEKLLPLLIAAPKPVVTTVSSLAHKGGRIDFDNLQGEKRYHAWSAYQQSKLANLLFAFELQRRSDANGWNLKSNAAHPGFAQTDLMANGPGLDSLFSRFSNQVLKPLMSHSASDGALPVLYAAVSPNAQPSGYYGPNGFYEAKGPVSEAFVSTKARDKQVAERLWTVSEKLVGAKFPVREHQLAS